MSKVLKSFRTARLTVSRYTNIAPGRFESVLLCIIWSVPFFLRVEIERGSASLLTTELPVADMLIWLSVTGLVVASSLRCRHLCDYREVVRNERIDLPFIFSFPFLPFALIAVLSCSTTTQHERRIPDLIQIIDYYVLFYWIALNAVIRTRTIVHCTLPIFVVLVGIAGYQFWSNTPTFLVRSLFRDHPSYVAALTMLTPVAWSIGASSPSPWNRAIANIAAALGWSSMGSLGGMIVVLFQLVVMVLILGRTALRSAMLYLLIGGILTLIWARSDYLHELARQSVTWIRVPMAERRSNVQFVKASLTPPPPSIHFGTQRWQFFIGTNMSWIVLFKESRDDSFGAEHPEYVLPEYYAESWSALQVILSSPLLGNGPGTFQKLIGTSFGVTERTGTTFPNTSNGYLHIGITLGVVGLLTWLVITCMTLKSIIGCNRHSKTFQDKCLGSACVAGLAGGSIWMLVCPFYAQPVAIYWILLVAIVGGIRLKGKCGDRAH